MLVDLSPLAALSLLIALSVVLNRVVEYAVGKPLDKISERYEKVKPFRWLVMYVALALGIYAAITYDLDLLSIEVFGLPPSLLGKILTGVILSGGANLLNDIWPKPPGQVTASASVSSNGETASASLSTPPLTLVD